MTLMGFLLLGLLLLALLLASSLMGCRERFANITGSAEEEVVQAFNTILMRDPTTNELRIASMLIRAGDMDAHALQTALISSDEYQRLVKLQSNTVSPELMRMIASREYLGRVSAIYKDIFKTTIPTDLLLPYNDLYTMMMGREDTTFRNMLLDPRYAEFEMAVLAEEELNRDALFSMYNSVFVNNTPIVKPTEPIPSYMTPEGTIGSNASMWTANDNVSIGTVIPPWKDRGQAETTYALYDEGETASPLPTVASMDTRTSVPSGPMPPLQGEVVGTSLATSASMLNETPKETASSITASS